MRERTLTRERTVTYCVVPRDLAAELHELLRRHWDDDRGVEVIVERRRDERRRTPRRRREGAPPGGSERRAVRNREGRRVGERRARSAGTPPPPLPPSAEPHADRLAFVQRRAPSDQASEDLETARLVVEYQLGDRSALEDIYLRYFDRIYAYARVALRDSHAAEDVTQQVFAQVVESLPRFELRRGIPFRAWLFRIARNAMLDVRGAQLRTMPEDPVVLEARRDGADARAGDAPLDWISDADLYHFVEQLPPVQRDVLVLRYVLDLSNVEIAAALDRTPAAIRQLLFRALRTLEQRLMAIGGNGDGHGERLAKRIRAGHAPRRSAHRAALGKHGPVIRARR